MLMVGSTSPVTKLWEYAVPRYEPHCHYRREVLVWMEALLKSENLVVLSLLPPLSTCPKPGGKLERPAADSFRLRLVALFIAPWGIITAFIRPAR